MSESLLETYGQVIELGQCVAGRNLNTWTLRGYASIKVLADISGGDVYDQYDNPGGTQRDLKVKHSKEALEYAMESLGLTSEESPRAFPEITLNVRDTSVITIFDSTGNEISADTIVNLDSTSIFNVRIRTSEIQWPIPDFSPQISRVDGNHRLSQAQDLEVEDEMPVPVVPFSFFLGLSPAQERKIFSDINGEHVGMPASILTIFETEALPDDVAVATPLHRAAWLARQLTTEDMAFYGKVYFGGSAAGVKAKFGNKPSITIQGLKTAVQKTLDQSPTLTAFFFPAIDLSDPVNNTEIKKKERVDKAKTMVRLLNRYWTAVRDSNPEAWEDKKQYLLTSTVGLMGYSHLAGPVIENLVLAQKKSDYAHFKAVTDYISIHVPLKKEDYVGVAGAGGIRVISEKLMSVWAQNDVNTAIAATDLDISHDPLDSI